MRVHFLFEPDSPARFLELGLLAEQLGFDAVGAPNILQSRDPFLAFSLLARDSRRIRLGPVAVSPFELHPARMANSILTLNEISGGRANLTVGGGGGAMIAMNLKPDRQSTIPRMVDGVRECLEFLRQAATGKRLDFAGELFRIDGYQAPWAASLPPPKLYVAANRPRMLKLATELGDGVMLSDISLHYLPETVAQLKADLSRAGRDPADFPINNVIAWHVKADRAEAFAEARKKLWVRGLWERARLEPYVDAKDCDLVMSRLPALARAYALGEDPAAVVPRPVMDALADGLTLVGGETELPRLLERVQAFRAGGVTELNLRLYGAPEDSIRLVARALVPALGG